MDPVLADAYSTVLSGAPFVIAAYALILVIMFALVIAMLVESKKTQKDIDTLRDALDRRERKEADTDAR